MLYDMHAHLDLYPKNYDALKYVEENRVYTIVATNLPSLYQDYKKKYATMKYARFGLGFHPELVPQYHDQLPIFLKELPHAKYIGEIGLDFSTPIASEREVQVAVFKNIIRACKECGIGKILCIHSRGAAKDTIEIAGEYQGTRILHWPSCTIGVLMEAVEKGFYFSVNEQMVDSASGRSLIAKIPLEKVLLESDAPFTKRSKTKYDVLHLIYTVNQLAELFGMHHAKMEAVLFENFRSVIS